MTTVNKKLPKTADNVTSFVLPAMDDETYLDIWDAFKCFNAETKLDSPYIHVLDDKTFDMSRYEKLFAWQYLDGDSWEVIPVRVGRRRIPQDRQTDIDDRVGVHGILLRSGYLASFTLTHMARKLAELPFAVVVQPKPDFDVVERQLCRQRIFLASARGCHVIVHAAKGFSRDGNSITSYLNIAQSSRSSKPKLNVLFTAAG